MKTMCPPGYHHNDFVATHALGHMMYGYKLLVAVNQRVFNKQSKGRNISGDKLSPTHRVLKSHRSKMGVISCHKAIVVITGRAHCFHDYIYITPTLLL